MRFGFCLAQIQIFVWIQNGVSFINNSWSFIRLPNIKRICFGFQVSEFKRRDLMNRSPSYFQKFTRFKMHEEAFEEQRKLSL